MRYNLVQSNSLLMMIINMIITEYYCPICLEELDSHNLYCSTCKRLYEKVDEILIEKFDSEEILPDQSES